MRRPDPLRGLRPRTLAERVGYVVGVFLAGAVFAVLILGAVAVASGLLWLISAAWGAIG